MYHCFVGREDQVLGKQIESQTSLSVQVIV